MYPMYLKSSVLTMPHRTESVFSTRGSFLKPLYEKREFQQGSLMVSYSRRFSLMMFIMAFRRVLSVATIG